jgi:hypothetical protein
MAKSVPHCPLEVKASDSDNAEGASYFSKNSEKIKQDLLKHGAIWFRGFDLMKSVKGYREMYEALGFEPCLDPLHSSGLRKFASERDALYEEVRIVLCCCNKSIAYAKLMTHVLFFCFCFEIPIDKTIQSGKQTIPSRTLYRSSL